MINTSRLRTGDILGSLSGGIVPFLIDIFQRKVCRIQGINVPRGTFPTHIGIIRKTSNGVFVIEALMNRGVSVSPYEKYKNIPHNIYRFTKNAFLVTGLPEKKARQKFASEALKFNGAPYDFLGLLEIVLFAFGIKQKLNEESRLFCSELVGCASLKAGLPPFFPKEIVKKALLAPIHIALSELTYSLK